MFSLFQLREPLPASDSGQGVQGSAAYFDYRMNSCTSADLRVVGSSGCSPWQP